MPKGPFRHIDEIREANEAKGGNWFSRDTMRFFKSRVLEGVYGGRYFVTSERYSMDHPRLYTVRRADDDGSIATVGGFQRWRTAALARAAAKRIETK